jgi:hypothetical protein
VVWEGTGQLLAAPYPDYSRDRKVPRITAWPPNSPNSHSAPPQCLIQINNIAPWQLPRLDQRLLRRKQIPLRIELVERRRDAILETQVG